jgi:hypothetical protein
MSDKDTLLREADETFGTLRGSISGLTDEAMSRVWLGTWSVRDILVHISGWHREMIPVLGRIERGETPHPAGAYDDFHAWNARFVAARAGAKAADVLAELEASHRDLMAAARAVSEAHFAKGGAARDLVDGVGPGHYREHAGQITGWRQQAGV